MSHKPIRYQYNVSEYPNNQITVSGKTLVHFNKMVKN